MNWMNKWIKQSYDDNVSKPGLELSELYYFSS